MLYICFQNIYLISSLFVLFLLCIYFEITSFKILWSRYFEFIKISFHLTKLTHKVCMNIFIFFIFSCNLLFNICGHFLLQILCLLFNACDLILKLIYPFIGFVLVFEKWSVCIHHMLREKPHCILHTNWYIIPSICLDNCDWMITLNDLQTIRNIYTIWLLNRNRWKTGSSTFTIGKLSHYTRLKIPPKGVAALFCSFGIQHSTVPLSMTGHATMHRRAFIIVQAFWLCILFRSSASSSWSRRSSSYWIVRRLKTVFFYWSKLIFWIGCILFGWGFVYLVSQIDVFMRYTNFTRISTVCITVDWTVISSSALSALHILFKFQ